VPRWFTSKLNEKLGVIEYEYKGGYLESRERGVFENVMDIY